MKFWQSLSFTEPEHLLGIARKADEVGFDGAFMSDHVWHPTRITSAYPYSADGKPSFDENIPWPDPWVMIGALAAVTTKLRFSTATYILPLRPVLQVAKTVGTAADLSRGRVALGIGVGWMKEEFELLQVDYHTRGKRMDEEVEILRTLWRGGMVEYHGKHYDFDRLEMSPVPKEPVPILVGGVSDVALKRAARLGDGWIAVQHSTEELRELLGKLAALRKDYGTDGKPFETVVACTDVFDVDGYRRIEDLGATTLTTAPWVLYGADPNSLEEKKDALKRFADDVISKFKD